MVSVIFHYATHALSDDRTRCVRPSICRFKNSMTSYDALELNKARLPMFNCLITCLQNVGIIKHRPKLCLKVT